MRSRRRRALRCAAPALLACAAQSAAAWGNLLLIEPAPEQRTLAVGPSVWSLPRYPGARAMSTVLIPGVDYYAPSGLYASTDTGIGWNLGQHRELQGGLRLWPQFGRREADAPPGVEAIGTRLQGEAYLNWAPRAEVLLQSALLKGAGHHHDGVQLELGATSGLPMGDELLAIGLAANFANQAYRQSYFGVPSAGWQDLSLSFSAEHHIAPGWRLSGQLIFVRLLGGAARSPWADSARQTGATLTLWRDL